MSLSWDAFSSEALICWRTARRRPAPFDFITYYSLFETYRDPVPQLFCAHTHRFSKNLANDGVEGPHAPSNIKDRLPITRPGADVGILQGKHLPQDYFISHPNCVVYQVPSVLVLGLSHSSLSQEYSGTENSLVLEAYLEWRASTRVCTCF